MIHYGHSLTLGKPFVLYISNEQRITIHVIEYKRTGIESLILTLLLSSKI